MNYYIVNDDKPIIKRYKNGITFKYRLCKIPFDFIMLYVIDFHVHDAVCDYKHKRVIVYKKGIPNERKEKLHE